VVNPSYSLVRTLFIDFRLCFFVRSFIRQVRSFANLFVCFFFVSFISLYNQKTSTTAVITHAKTVDHAKMVSTVIRVSAQLGTVGIIVKIVSSNHLVIFFLCLFTIHPYFYPILFLSVFYLVLPLVRSFVRQVRRVLIHSFIVFNLLFR